MISIVMPVYNSEKFLSKTIASVQDQSYGDFELIAVNDGSTDGSLKILSDLAAKDTRIRVIDQKNAGPSRARNNGIDHAQGEWIYFMDSDDILEKNALEGLMEVSGGYDLTVFGLEKHIYGENGGIVRQFRMSLPDTALDSKEELRRYLGSVIRETAKDVFFSYIWNKLFRTAVIKGRGLRFNEKVSLGEDFVFNTEVLKYTDRVRIVSAPWYHYLVRGGNSLVGRFYPNELDRRKLMYSSMTGLYRHYDMYDECREYLELNEGKTSLVCMNKINTPACRLSTREKIRYVDGFLKDERRDFMIRYLRRKGNPKSYAESVLIGLKNPVLVYAAIRKT